MMHLPNIDFELMKPYLDSLYEYSAEHDIQQKAINDVSSKHDQMLEKATIEKLESLNISFEDKADFYEFIKGKIYRVTHVDNHDYFEVWLNYNNKLVFLFEYSTKVVTDFSYENMKSTFTAVTELRFFQPKK